MSAGGALIGLTGGIGSGKTTVANAFAALGAAVVDVDQIAHALTQAEGAAMVKIRQQFGAGVIASSGALDRAAMRQLVFTDPKARNQLEAILHPMIATQTRETLIAADGPYRIVVVPLLVEKGNWLDQVDRVLVVDCPESLQVERVMQRSALTQSQVQAIMAAQASRAQRLEHADDIIENAAQPEAILAQVATLHRRYLELNAERSRSSGLSSRPAYRTLCPPGGSDS